MILGLALEKITGQPLAVALRDRVLRPLGLRNTTDNGGTRFNAAQVGIRAMWMVDVLVRSPQAFVVSTSLSA